MPTIVYEDNHLIAINKPSGMLVQGDITGDIPLTELMKKFIKERDSKPGNVFVGLIHRLDRPVSGLVLLAKTSKSLERMNRIFATREVTKEYLAKTHFKPKKEAETLRHYLLKNEKENYVKAFDHAERDAKESILSYKIYSKKGADTILKITPQTGRSHQIRVQLAAIGCPIIGDTKYGSSRSNADQSICLHSWKLRFIHPIQKEELTIETQQPKWAL